MPDKKQNIAASVKARLKNKSLETGKNYDMLLRQFAQERFLYRLSKSIYVNNMILKGAMLFLAHNISRNRPTKDIDFLATSVSNERTELENIVKEILRIKYDDGLSFEVETVESEDIVEDADYHGVRLKFLAFLEKTKVTVKIDVGFGDKITAGPVDIEFPVLLDFPQPLLKVYSLESSIAEKFEAIVSLQLQTSRMKDFFDIEYFAGSYGFNKALLKEALETTFENRETDIKERLLIWEDKFKTDEQKQVQWTAFLDRNDLTSEYNFAEIVERIKQFIEPVFSEHEKENWNYEEWKWV